MERPLRRGPWIALACLLAFLALVRLRLAEIPLERDEGEYAYAGQLILQGIPPYQLVYNMKFPGTYYAYAAILSLFGQSVWGIRVGLLCVNLATVILVFLLARRVLGSLWPAVAAAAAFGILSLDQWILGVFAHATHFVVVAAMGGLLVLLRALESGRTVSFLAAGALLGTSVLMKQNGIFLLAGGIALVVGAELRRESFDARSALHRAALVTLGGAIPFASLCAALLAQGVLGSFAFWTFQYALEYASELSPSEGWTMLTSTARKITQTNLAIWVLGALGLPALWLTQRSNGSRGLIIALLVISVIAVCPGLYFRSHYFILVLPAVAILVGASMSGLQALLSRAVSARAAWALAAGVFLVAVGSYVLREREYLFWTPAPEISRGRYGTNPFVESPEIAAFIRERTSPDDRIAVLGSEPQIYFLANRKSATGYVYTYPLMERHRFAQRMQDEMIEEIERSHPKVVVFVNIATSWLLRDGSQKILLWADRYLGECYERVGVVDILPEGPTKYVWDEPASTYAPVSRDIVFLFERSSSEPCTGAIRES